MAVILEWEVKKVLVDNWQLSVFVKNTNRIVVGLSEQDANEFKNELNALGILCQIKNN